MMSDLAALVAKDDAEATLAALKRTGTYDTDRAIRSIDGDRLAVPVLEAVAQPGVIEFRRDLALTRRCRTLEDHLAAAGWSATELERAPADVACIGDIVLVSDPLDYRPHDVGRALLEVHGRARTVLAQHAIETDRRRPRVTHVAGAERTETVHREHGVTYRLDLADVMFSPGNQRERARMGEVVRPGERVLDLCAGIGYFALPMATAGARVTAIERNPAAFRWLSANASANGVAHLLVPVPGDCRGTPVEAADRAVVGHLPVHDCRDDPTAAGGGYLDAALRALSPDGHLHVHGIAWADEHDHAAARLGARLRRRGVVIDDLTTRRVKGLAEATDHLVFDVSLR